MISTTATQWLRINSSYLLCFIIYGNIFHGQALAEDSSVVFRDKYQDMKNQVTDNVVFVDRFNKPTTSVSERMCAQYTAQACGDTIPYTKLKPFTVNFTRTLEKPHVPDLITYYIMGGRNSQPKEYPHMALLGYGDYYWSLEWKCGGSLISEKYILTAAHCVTTNLGRPTWVRLGELNLTSNKDDATPIDYPITQIIVYPGYNRSLLYHDIALIRFQGVSSFSDYIRPICLNNLYDFRTTKVTAVGWGSTGYGEVGSDHLLAVDLNVESNEPCRTLYKGDELPHGYDTNTMICVGYAPGGRDSCQGDSGGPLLILNKNSTCSYTYKQVGIISFGIGCALENTPAIYTRVSYYVPWIERIVWK